jgi:hypothetical protein
MTEPKFTPGPWRHIPWHEEEGPPAILAPAGWRIASFASEYDAKLCSFAPELYRELALKDPNNPILAKARGEL